jgi:hypothetical protein
MDCHGGRRAELVKQHDHQKKGHRQQNRCRTVRRGLQVRISHYNVSATIRMRAARLRLYIQESLREESALCAV